MPACLAARPVAATAAARRTAFRRAARALARRIAPLALAALAAAGCVRDQSPGAQRLERLRHGSGDLVIAAPWPWTAKSGIRYGDGMELAVEEVNAAGGVRGRRLRILRVDDRESVDQGRVVAQQIASNPDVVAVVGHLQSYVTVPAAAIYDMAGLVHVAPTASDPQLTMLGYKRVFRCTFTHRHIGRALADEAHARGLGKIAIYYMRDGYGRGLANAFEERANEVHMDVAARRSFDANQRPAPDAVEQMVSEWKALEVGGVFMAGESPEAVQLLRAMHKVGLTVPVLGGDATGTPQLIADAGPAAEGMIVAATFSPDDPRPEVQRFVRAFHRRFGVGPDAGAALGYNAVSLLAHAMQSAPSADPADVATALRKLHDWPSLLGPVSFDETGDMTAPRVVKLLVRDGRYALVGDTAPAVASAR